MQDMTNQNNESSDVNALKSSSDKSSTHMVDDCKFCGMPHERNREKCPAFGKVCKKCKKEDHVASKRHLHEKKTGSKKKKPKAPKSSSKETSRKKVSFVETDLSLEEEILSVDLSTEDDNVSTSEVINFVTDFPNKIYAVMEIQGKPVRMQIDSGASCNVLPEKYLPGVAEIQKSNKLLTAYNKRQISSLGTARVSMRNPRTRKKYVGVDGNYTPSIGARAANQMGLLVVQHHNIQLVSNNKALTSSQSSPLTKAQVLTAFADIFKGLGRMEGKLHLEVDD